VIFVLLYRLFNSTLEAAVLISPSPDAMTGGPLLQYSDGFQFQCGVWVECRLFGIAVGVRTSIPNFVKS